MAPREETHSKVEVGFSLVRGKKKFFPYRYSSGKLQKERINIFAPRKYDWERGRVECVVSTFIINSVFFFLNHICVLLDFFFKGWGLQEV